MKQFSAWLLSLAFLFASTICLTAQEQDHAASVELKTPVSVSNPGIPQFVRFSGVLHSPAGESLTGVVVVHFALYQEQSGGEPLWQETQQVIADAQGRYTVLLGATEPSGLSLALFQSGDAHWLAVSSGQAKEMPRTLLAAVPYALKAADAETLGGRPLSAFVLTGTKSGTGSDGLSYVNPNASGGGGGVKAITSSDGSIVVTNGTNATDLRTNFAGTGAAATAARSDHNHDAAYLKLSGGALAGPLTFASGQTFPGSGVTGIVANAATAANLTGSITESQVTGLAGDLSSKLTPASPLNASNLTGTVPPFALAGTYNVNIVGNADTASSASIALLANHATTSDNSLALNGLPPDSFATVGANSFGGSQVIHGNLTIAGAGNGIMFPDGTSQTTASTGGGTGVPSGYMILSTSPVAPPGYTLSPVTLSTGAASWATLPPMPIGAYALAAAQDTQGNIYAIGGYNGGYLNAVEKYSPSTDTWATVASMPTARYGLAAAADQQGNIYAIGGYNGGYLNTVEEYSPSTDTWTTAASMPTQRYLLAAAADAQGNIYAIGGANNVVEKYSPSTNTWTTVSSLRTARSGPAAAADQQGNIYAIGGYNNSYLNTVEKYNPTTDTWTSVASMATARYVPAAAADAQGNIYAIGGFEGNAKGLATAERYSPGQTLYVFIKN